MRSLARLNRLMDSVRDDVAVLKKTLKYLALRQDAIARRHAALVDELVRLLSVPLPAETLSGVEVASPDVLHDLEKGNHRGAPTARENAADQSLRACPRDPDVLSGHGRFPFSKPFRTDLDPRKGVDYPSGVNTQRSLAAASRKTTAEASEVAPGPKTKSDPALHSLVDFEPRRGGRSQ